MEKKTQINGVALHYTLEGPQAAPVVTFCHSLAADSTLWALQRRALASTYRVLCFDWRGHGGSDSSPGPYTFEQLADDARALLAKLGIDRTHFVGMSMGGMVGQVLALRSPEILSSLTLCDTTAMMPKDRAASWDAKIAAASTDFESLVGPAVDVFLPKGFSESHPEVVEMVKTMFRRTSPEGYIACAHPIRDFNVIERLHEIRVPTLVVVGEQDMGTPVPASKAIAERIPGARLHVLANAAHLSNLAQPDEFNRVIGAFIAEVSEHALAGQLVAVQRDHPTNHVRPK